MQPFRQVGLSVAVAAGTPNTPVPAANPEAAVLLVTNESATVWGYFSPMIGADDGTAWPPVITPAVGSTPASTTHPIPAAGLGTPIPPNGQVFVAVSRSIDHYAAQGTALVVTPVELLKTQ